MKKHRKFKNDVLLRYCRPNSLTALHFAFNLVLSDVNNGCRVTVKDFTPCKGIRIVQSERFLLVESGIQLKDTGIGLTISSIDKDWNPKSTAWNPESKTVLDFLTWGGRFFREGYSLVQGALSLTLAKAKDLSLVSHRRSRTK